MHLIPRLMLAKVLVFVGVWEVNPHMAAPTFRLHVICYLIVSQMHNDLEKKRRKTVLCRKAPFPIFENNSQLHETLKVLISNFQ